MKKVILIPLLIFSSAMSMNAQELLTDLVWVKNITSSGGYYIDATNPSNSGVIDLTDKIKSEIKYQLRVVDLKVGDYQEGKSGYFIFSFTLNKLGNRQFFLEGFLSFYQNVTDKTGRSQAAITWQDIISDNYGSKYAAQNDIENIFKESSKDFVKAYLEFN